MSTVAECSHCDYARKFAPTLGGRFYRCPKCREGVLAVPATGDEESQVFKARYEAWVAHSSRQIRRRQDAAGDRPPAAEPDEASGPGPDEDTEEAAAGAEPIVADEESQDAAERPNFKGEIASARTILVECGLCGYHVRVPPAFFGKTVHCPECRGDTVFSESALEPVKDELLDRLMLESRERDALWPTPTGGGGGRRSWTAAHSFVLGVGIGLIVLTGIWLLIRASRGE